MEQKVIIVHCVGNPHDQRVMDTFEFFGAFSSTEEYNKNMEKAGYDWNERKQRWEDERYFYETQEIFLNEIP